jgi:hypothetical protein
MRWKKSTVLLAMTLAMIVAAPFAANAASPSFSFNLWRNGDSLVNVAREWNGTNGQARTNIALTVQHSSNPRTRLQNQAISVSRCVGCSTVTIAVQIALLDGPNPVFDPVNTAFGVNAACLGCLTVGLAYQFVVSTRTPLALSDATKGQLDAIGNALEALPNSGLSADGMKSAADAQAAKIAGILKAAAAAGKVTQQDKSDLSPAL